MEAIIHLNEAQSGKPKPSLPANTGEHLSIEIKSQTTNFLSPLDVPKSPAAYAKIKKRRRLRLPQMSELDTVRHFTNLSRRNVGIDTTPTYLGSCSMKYNPRVHEAVAAFPGFTDIHPLQDPATVQGALHLLYDLQQSLAEIAGMDMVTLQPAAGAHGEFTGVQMMRGYHESRADVRDKIIIPDTAHGTNPATAAMVGYRVIEIGSDARGNIDIEALRGAMNPSVAGLMLTNPSTLGLFEEQILEIADIVHSEGGLVYMDGANMNALLGIAKPGELGMDILHYNLHKTFTTPHGGGGPGAGATAVVETLSPFLPKPVVARAENGEYYFDYDRPESIGRVRAFNGNFGNDVRALTYIRQLGSEGLREVSENAVLNANYLRVLLSRFYTNPYGRMAMHEVILSGERQAARGVTTADIVKRLMDFNFHPPTIYFPHTVAEAMLVEPTETESRQTLEAFARAMIAIDRETRTNPDLVRGAPYSTPVAISQADEATANRRPRLTWKK